MAAFFFFFFLTGGILDLFVALSLQGNELYPQKIYRKPE